MQCKYVKYCYSTIYRQTKVLKTCQCDFNFSPYRNNNQSASLKHSIILSTSISVSKWPLSDTVFTELQTLEVF